MPDRPLPAQRETAQPEAAQRPAPDPSSLPAALFRAAFEAAPLPMAVLDDDGAVVYANQALADVAGDESVAIAGRELLGVGGMLDPSAAELVAQLRSGQATVAYVESRLAAADGSVERVSLGVRALGGPFSGYLLAHVEAVSHLVSGADALPSHDEATGLVNAAVLADLLRMLLADPDTDGVAVLYCIVDDPAGLRDRHGPAIAEWLLGQAARRLGALLRTGDTAARYDAAEFVIVAMAEDGATADGFRRRLDATLAQPYELADRQLVVTVRTGLAWTHGGNGTPSADELLSSAEGDARRPR